MTGIKTLVLGGVRSGKSRLAERLATESGLPVTYIATATAQDQEMEERIAIHRRHRPVHWQLIEEPIQLASVLDEQVDANRYVLIDCLTLWLTNLLTEKDVALFKRERAALLSTLSTWTGQITLVSNETNMGITPIGELSRRYCDEAGKLHQDLAQICDRVVMTIAGLPQVLKGEQI